MRTPFVLSAAAAFLVGCGGGGDGGLVDPGGNGVVTGVVSGRGGGVPGASVALSGGPTEKTGPDGRYTFGNVAVGGRTLTLAPPAGFVLAEGQAASRTANVSAGAISTVDWSLRLADPTPRTVQVSLRATSFEASDVTIPVGSTVRWVNAAPITHTISPTEPDKPGAWPDQTVSADGATFEHTFASAGTYPYVCKLHAGMNGTVRVH